MTRLDIPTRRRALVLRRLAYSVADITKRLNEENISISQQAIFNLIRKYSETRSLLDLPRRARPRKLKEPMLQFLNEKLTENDEITARQARLLLVEKWPDLQVSIPTIKRVRREIGWVCTRPHYCQLLRDVSCYQCYYLLIVLVKLLDLALNRMCQLTLPTI